MSMSVYVGVCVCLYVNVAVGKSTGLLVAATSAVKQQQLYLAAVLKEDSDDAATSKH